ncbi:MAG: aminoacyl-tRNA hydrolase [Chloroflexi bacterium]|nr:aminoacyl-tRNA hydrolase [Chloroflexota bacterium]
MKLIVGLGNPGPQYANTRHNAGFQVVDRFAARHEFLLRKMQFNAMVISGAIAGEKVLVARPLTFMNDSGRAVGPLVRWLKLELPDLLVVYDEIDLPLGTLRLRPDGGSAGHNGMKSIIEQLGTESFARLRIGVGRPVGGGVSHVLGAYNRDELPLAEDAYDRAVAAIETFIADGLITAMNRFNAA